LRFTPMCVGTTNSLAKTIALSAVHPHVRGDNLCRQVALMKMFGSPPRAWGQLIQDVLNFKWKRFTPTCVGTTSRGQSALFPNTVHPHVRGDNVIHQGLQIGPAGSPPRAWGQPTFWTPSEAERRFTPTCVGTTPLTQTPRCLRPVHPHVRGDNTDQTRIIEARGSTKGPRSLPPAGRSPPRCA
jgi:hypothetical protein